MGESIFISIFLFFGVIAITVFIFGGWVLVMIIRGIGLLFRPLLPDWYHRPRTRNCPRRDCGETNPAIARFCRRCGQEL